MPSEAHQTDEALPAIDGQGRWSQAPTTSRAWVKSISLNAAPALAAALFGRPTAADLRRGLELGQSV